MGEKKKQYSSPKVLETKPIRFETAISGGGHYEWVCGKLEYIPNGVSIGTGCFYPPAGHPSRPPSNLH